MLLTFLVSKFHPIKILQYKFIFLVPFLLSFPFLLMIINSELQLFIIQFYSLLLGCTAFPANPILFKYFPILQRFTVSSFTFSIAKAVTYGITSFGTIYLFKFFGHTGLLFLLVPVNVGYFIALNFFKRLEIKGNFYH